MWIQRAHLKELLAKFLRDKFKRSREIEESCSDAYEFDLKSPRASAPQSSPEYAPESPPACAPESPPTYAPQCPPIWMPASAPESVPKKSLPLLACGCGCAVFVVLITVFGFGFYRYVIKSTPSPSPTPAPSSTPLPANTVSLRLTPEGPSRISANEQVPIGITISLEGQPDDNPVLLDGTRQYLVATRLQPGAFEVSADYLKARENVLKAGLPVKWHWIVAPKLDRLGAQKISFDTDVYDQTTKQRLGSRSLIATIEVENPIGLPNWVVYALPLVGLVALIPISTIIGTDVSNRLKERRECKRKLEDEKRLGEKAISPLKQDSPKSQPSTHAKKKNKKPPKKPRI